MKTKLLNPKHWIRLLIMVLLCFVLGIIICYAIPIIFVVQWVLTLFTGDQNARLKDFSGNLNTYMHQILQYLSFHSEQAPFPLSDWPTK
ncbi:MAG: hypothetical protein ACI9J2_001783 [Saprospiraceae bacterium]|jgi:hypothetical protein